MMCSPHGDQWDHIHTYTGGGPLELLRGEGGDTYTGGPLALLRGGHTHTHGGWGVGGISTAPWGGGGYNVVWRTEVLDASLRATL